MGVSETLAVAVSPVNKLIDAITGAIGTAYQPRHLKKMADAKAYELRTIGEELRNNADLPIIYNGSGDYTIDITDYESLVNRAGKRIAFQEITKQENIENIVDKACENLSRYEICEEGEITREWMYRFIDASGDISSEDMQNIWSKVLSGEVLRPRSFSLRTLECLRNMDVEDASIFEALCSVVVGNDYVINDDSFLLERGITYDMILRLDEGGLINSSGMIELKKEIGTEATLVTDFGEYVLVGEAEKNIVLELKGFPLTTAGKELSRVVGKTISIDDVKELCRIIKKHNKEVLFSLHKVDCREDNELSYNMDMISFE